jgi:hypothetical protein
MVGPLCTADVTLECYPPSREVVIPQRDVKELETFVMNFDIEQWVVPGEEGSTLTTVPLLLKSGQ